MRFLTAAATSGLVLALLTPTRAGLITIDSSQTAVEILVGNPQVSADLQINSSSLIPTLATITAASGDGSSETRIEYSEQGAGNVLNWDFDIARGGDPRYFVYSTATLAFTANMNATYSMSGSFELNGSQRVYLEGNLFDLTTASHVFANLQESRGTDNQALILGHNDGDWGSGVQGSLSGNLIAGHEYRLFYWAFLDNLEAADGGATGFGNVRLEIGDVQAGAAAPEPASFVLVALGAAGSIFGARKRRRVKDAIHSAVGIRAIGNSIRGGKVPRN